MLIFGGVYILHKRMPQLPTIDLSGFGAPGGLDQSLVVKVQILDVFLLGDLFYGLYHGKSPFESIKTSKSKK